MADIYTTATSLAILQAGRTPVWEAQDADDALLPPDAADAGVYLEKAVRALLQVTLREQAHRRTVRLTIPVIDLTCTYTVTIDGNSVAYNATVEAPADLAELLEGISDAVNADGTVNDIVSSSVVSSAIVLRGVGEADYAVNFTEDSGATIAAVADLCSAKLRLWWIPAARPDSVAPTVWAWSGEVYAVERRGALVRLDTAGLSRLHPQLSERVGHPGDGSIVTYSDPTINVGACLSELEA